MSVRPVIQQQLATGSTGRDDGEFAIGFLGFGVANGDDGFNRAVPFEQGAADSDWFSAH